MTEYILGGLVIAVVTQAAILAYVFLLVDRLRRYDPRACCKKATEAWEGVDAIYKWIEAVGFHEWIDCVNDAIKNLRDCTPGADPSWPPKDPGDFPPE